MKNRKNLLLVVLLLVVVAVATASTYAWLTDTGNAAGGTYTIGDVKYTISAPTNASGVVVPGQPLSGPTITNASNVASNLRVKFSVSVNVTNASNVNASTAWTIGTVDTDHLLLTLNTTNWVKHTDGYYYYGSVNDDKVATGNEDIATTKTEIEALFTSLVINGKVVGNDYSGAVVTITVTYEAKQAEYVQWNELTSQSFSFVNGI